MKATHPPANKIPFTADFKKRAKQLFPKEKELHQYLKEGSWKVRMFLDGSMAFDFSPQEIIDLASRPAKYNSEPQSFLLSNLIEEAWVRLNKEKLCDEFEREYGKICNKVALRHFRALAAKQRPPALPGIDKEV